MDLVKYNFDYINKEKSYFRKSFLIKVVIGSGFISSSAACLSLFLVQAGFQSNKYIYNFTKGSILLNISLLTLNELYYILFLRLRLYENFCITYFLSGMTIYPKFLGILVRQYGNNYFEAKFYARKNILYLISFWITFELIFKIKKKNITYDDIDIIDIVEKYYSDLNTNPNFDDMFQLRKEINKIVINHKNNISMTIYNSKRKKEELQKYIKINDGKVTFDVVDFIIYYLYINFKENELKRKNL